MNYPNGSYLDTTSLILASQTRITLRNVGMTWGRNWTHLRPRDLKIKVTAWTTMVWWLESEGSLRMRIRVTIATAG